MERVCLACGMEVGLSQVSCPKCDGDLDSQTDGSVLHKDIAHQHETIAQAREKFLAVLEEARNGHAQAVRLVVGRGLIRDEVNQQLEWMQRSNEILSFDYDSGNTGAIVVQLRRP